MRKLLYILIIIAICGLPSIAQASGHAGGLPDKSGNSKKRVRAGVFNFDGYHMKDAEGKLSGYGMDLLNLLSEYSHLNFIYKGYEKSWQDMQQMLKDGEIDLVTSARRTPAREKVFTFSLPVGRNHTMLTKQLYNRKLRAGDYSTYNGMKIGIIKGSSQNWYLPDFAREKGFEYETVEFESPMELAEALQKGEVDAILSSNLRKSEKETLLDIVKSDNFYVIARKEDQALIDEINYAIEQMNLNEGDWQNDIYFKYYSPYDSNTGEFSEREKNYIDDVNRGNKKITALARGDMKPYSFIEDGEIRGILPDYFARVMRVAGLPFEIVIPENAADYREKAENNKVDVVLDRLDPYLNSENERQSGFAISPYMTTGLAKVMRTDLNRPVEVVGLPEKTPLDLQPEVLKGVETRMYPSSKDAIHAVQKGEVDAAYVLPFSAQMYVNREPGHNLMYTMTDDGGASFRMYVPGSAAHELATILKKAIAKLPAGTLNQLGSQYAAYDAGEMTIWHYLYSNPHLLMFLALSLIIALSLYVIMWLRGRWNRQLLQTTASANQELEGQLAIVEALSRDYTNVLALNSDTGVTSPVKIADYVNPINAATQEGEEQYEKIFHRYVNTKVHPEDREYMTKALSLANVRKQLASRDEFVGTYRTLENGRVQYFQYTFVIPHGNAEPEENLILIGIRNIDDVIRREQEQKRKLSEALKKARYASAAKTAFLNNMSHDIRTPMNAIIGFTALAESNVSNEALVKRYLGKIMTSGKHLLSLINDVLDMSRIESGKVKIEEKEVHLPEILHDLRTIAQADVKSKQLNFQIDTLNVINETIFCDRLRLNQVLLNILSNAMKYTPAGGQVSVRVEETGNVENGKATFEFHVKDSGIGMSEEFLKHVFEPFEREQTSTVSGIQGTGLGLAITKNIVDMMGGKISVKSEVGKGSEFTVVFQFRVNEMEEKNLELPQYRGVRALVVDDDLNTCTSLGKMLSELGLNPNWTTHAREALVRSEFAREDNKAYGVYIIDWMLADMNGLELARQLRKIVPESVPIIILTAYDWTEQEEEGKKAGVTAFCSKPIFLSELRNILAKPVTAEEKLDTESHESELFKGRNILLVEDNEMNQEIAQMILEDAGFNIDIVENGKEAVEKMEQTPAGHYALILMDVQMPVMNGYEATRKIRKLDDKAKAQIPVIAMTANAFDEDREEALKAGMNGYVAKPIDIDKLMETLKDFLKDRTDQIMGA